MLPEAITPAEFAQRYGWSERLVRSKARELGACRILGNRMVLLPQDATRILEARERRCATINLNMWEFAIVMANGRYRGQARLAAITPMSISAINVLRPRGARSKVGRIIATRMSNLERRQEPQMNAAYLTEIAADVPGRGS